jgi:outer membrane protein OmpA-like peptidoglycan-associated protein
MGMQILSMSKKQSPILLLVSTLLITACSSKNFVVLIPDPDGNVGSVTVYNKAGSVEIYTPNQVATIKDRDTAPSSPVDMEKKEIDTLFSEALAIQPPAPIHFRLYFERDSIKLKPDSSKILPDIITTIQRREPADISVIGHTDTLGEKIYNLNLSKRRALAVRDLLIKMGVQKEHITTTFHGEEDLLIKTEDNVSNPKNRRAEVIVR